MKESPLKTAAAKLISSPIRESEVDSLYDFDPSRSAKILARTFYRELKRNGYSHNQILALSTELIGLVTSDIDGPKPS